MVAKRPFYTARGALQAAAAAVQLADLSSRVNKKAKTLGLGGFGSRRGPTYSRSLRNTSDPNDAEQSIGYGTHDAKKLYRSKSRKKKPSKKTKSRKLISKSLKKKQKQLVRRIVKGTGVPKARLSSTQFNNIKQIYQDQADRQSGVVYAICPGFTGINRKEDHGNAMHQIFKQVFATADVEGGNLTGKWEAFQTMKIHFKRWTAAFELFNNTTAVNLGIKMYQFVCKKTIPYAEVEGTGPVGDIKEMLGVAPTTLEDMFLTYGNAPEYDQGAGAMVDVASYDTLHWEPTNLPLIKKYFKLEKIDRYELQAGAKIIIDASGRIDWTIPYKTVANNAFIKNVSRVVYFMAHGNCFSDYNTGVMYNYSAKWFGSATTVGLTTTQTQNIYWRPVFGGIDTLVSSDKYKLAASCNLVKSTTDDSNSRMNVA